MDINEAVAAAIRQERDRIGLSNADLIKRSGLKSSTYYRKIDAERDLTVKEAYLLAEAVGLTLLEVASEAERIRGNTEVSTPSNTELDERLRVVEELLGGQAKTA